MEDFNTFYQNLLAGDLSIIENERNSFIGKFFKRVWLSIFFLAAIVLGVYYFAYPFFNLTLVFVFVYLFALVIALIRMYNKFYGNYKTHFKTLIVPKMIMYVDNRLQYFPNSSMMDAYHESGIFTKNYDKYRAEDVVKGVLGSTSLSFGEIHTENKTYYTDKNGVRHESWHTIFKGIFFTSDFQKNFHGETYVDEDFLEKNLGWLGRKFQSWNSERKGALLRMENPKFEKNFATYSTDEQEARYILSLSMMEKMNNLRNDLKVKLNFAFLNNKVFIAASNNKDFFEPKVFSQSFSEKDCLGLVSVLKNMTGIVEELDLNTRIWSKE